MRLRRGSSSGTRHKDQSRKGQTVRKEGKIQYLQSLKEGMEEMHEALTR